MTEGPLPASVFKGLEFLAFFAAVIGALVWQYLAVDRDIKRDEREAKTSEPSPDDPQP